jgi:uncharacterized protein
MPDIWIERFQQEALPDIIKNINPLRVLFFGSRITGKATDESDIDIIIISNEFIGTPFIKRMEKILRIAKFPKHVDYLCYTPEEFENIKTSSSIIENALEECMEIRL